MPIPLFIKYTVFEKDLHIFEMSVEIWVLHVLDFFINLFSDFLD